MLVIQPAADGRLRISNAHRTELARDVASARTLAYAWGHTDVSINKALAEMKAPGASEPPGSAWRTARSEPVKRRREPAPARPVAEAPPATKAPPAKVPAKKAPAKQAAVEPAPSRKPAAEKTQAPARKASAAKKGSSEPKPPTRRKVPAGGAADGRARALAHFQAGARELAALERDTLPFARAPWSELRQMAEHISACLDGRKPRGAGSG